MKYISLLLAFVGVLVLYPGKAAACFCWPPDFSQSIMSAKAIFSGKIVEKSSEEVVFEIDGVWKGKFKGKFR